jgi:hypothetical protein
MKGVLKMPQTDPAPTDPQQEISLAVEQERIKQSMKAVDRLVERIAPTLVDFGTWIFGGLIAFTLLIMASLLTIGPVDPAIMVATTTFALALPLNIAGLFLLRLVQDLAQMGFEEEVTQAFQEVGLTEGGRVPTPQILEAQRKRRTAVFLRFSVGILALSAILTLAGMIATLWHMAWWIGVAFFAMIVISLGIVIIAFGTSLAPDSSEEKLQKRRYREEILRQAKAQPRK